MTPAVYRCVCGWSGSREACTLHPRQGFTVCPRCWPHVERVPKRTHDLKTWPEPFRAIVRRQKTHEVRRADRDFQVGDVLHLLKWDPQRDLYPGGSTDVRVTYISAPGTWGLPADLCVMSIERIDEP